MAMDVLMFVSALAIAVCFLSLAWFINYLGLMERNEALFASLSPGSTIPSQSVVGTANPFSLEVSERRPPPNRDVTKGVSVTGSCQVPCLITCFWGVQKDALSSLVDESDEEGEAEMSDRSSESFDQLLAGSYSSKSKTQHLNRTENFCMSFQPVEEDVESLTQSQDQQNLYSLVIAMEVTSETRENLDQQYYVVAFISIFGSTQNKEDLKIIQQCVQTLDGNVFTVQKLFVSETEVPCQRSDNREQPRVQTLCVVCQSEPVTRALLPCRHACLCGHCFQRLTQCPICRSVMTSYFLLQKEPRSLQQDSGLSQYLQQMSWWQITQRIFSAS